MWFICLESFENNRFEAIWQIKSGVCAFAFDAPVNSLAFSISIFSFLCTTILKMLCLQISFTVVLLWFEKFLHRMEQFTVKSRLFKSQQKYKQQAKKKKCKTRKTNYMVLRLISNAIILFLSISSSLALSCIKMQKTMECITIICWWSSSAESTEKCPSQSRINTENRFQKRPTTDLYAYILLHWISK